MRKYTYHNAGTVTSFAPEKKTQGRDGLITLLDFHKELVRDAERSDVYILDHKGRYLPSEQTA